MFGERLRELKERGTLRSIRDRCTPQGRTIEIDGRTLLNFASNDYLGLSDHPAVKRAVTAAVEQYGAGSGASRLLSGGTALHRRLEARISDLKGTEAAVLFNSGYAANTGAVPALAGPDSVIFSDELNHASLIDGCRLSKAEVFIYRHRDVGHLADLMGRRGKRKAVIVTDSVFSMDGDIAPLAELMEAASVHEALLYIDDAHGTGVLGSGRGVLSHLGLSPQPFVIQMGTLSKALGSYGAFIAASEDTVGWLINTARTLIYSTALPAHVIAASIEAVEMILTDRSLIARLWNNRDLLAGGLASIGIKTPSETPIIPLIVGDDRRALEASRFLAGRGIYAPAIRRPAVKVPRIRFTVSALHQEEDIQRLLEALKEARDCGLL